MFQDALTGKRATRQSAALERKSSFLSDATFESISESETSTAPSSLQTIVRGPAALGQYAGMISEYEEEETASESPSPPSNHQGPLPPPLRRLGPPLINTLVLQEAGPDSENFANNLRKVSEQLLANNGRTRTSVSGPAGGSSRPGSVALLSPREQQQQRELAGSLLRITSGGPASIGQSSSSGSDSRPGSQQSLVHPPAIVSSSRPGSQIGGQYPPNSTTTTTGNSRPTPQLPSTAGSGRPGSFAGPPNTVGLPAAPHSSATDGSGVTSPGSSSIPTTPQARHHTVPAVQAVTTPLYPSGHGGGGRFASKLPRLSPGSYLPEAGGGGLLSTISQAALSDDESPPASHVANPLPKFNTAALARPSSSAARISAGLQQPNYENVETPKTSSSNRPPSVVNPSPPPVSTATAGPNSASMRPAFFVQSAAASPLLLPLTTTTTRPRIASPATVGSPLSEMTQGRYRAAAAQAKVSTIPEDPRRSVSIPEDPSAAYLPMMVRKSSSHLPRAVATSSPGSNGIK